MQEKNKTDAALDRFVNSTRPPAFRRPPATARHQTPVCARKPVRITLCVILALAMIMSIGSLSVATASEEVICEHVHDAACWAAPEGHECSIETGCIPLYSTADAVPGHVHFDECYEQEELICGLGSGREADEREDDTATDDAVEAVIIGWECAAMALVCEHALCRYGEPCLDMQIPEDSENPAESIEPVESVDPEVSIESADPEEPAESADPEGPVDPADQEGPVDPVDPVDPADPADPADQEEPSEPEKLVWDSGENDLIAYPMDIAPMAASDDIPSISVSATPQDFQTFEDPAYPGLQPTDLTVSVTVQISESYTTGGRIELPLDYIPTLAKYPSFSYGTDGLGALEPFFTLVTPAPPAPGSVVSGFDTTNPNLLVINLKNSSEPGFSAGSETIVLHFEFNTNWNQKIPKGMEFWSVSPVAYVGAAEAAAATAVSVSARTSAPAMTFVPTALTPANPDYYMGGEVQTRIYYIDPYYYENLFDDRSTVTNILYLDVPTNTVLSANATDYYTGAPVIGPATGGIAGDVPAGYTRYWREVHDYYGGPLRDDLGVSALEWTSGDWGQWHYNNYYTVRHYLNPITNNIPDIYSNGDTFTITFGALYTRKNDIQKNDTSVITYTKVDDIPWDLAIRAYTNTGYSGNPYSVCGIENGNTAADFTRGMRFFGLMSYGALTENQGTQPITGVTLELYQNSDYDTSPKLNFYQISIFALRYSAADTPNIYDVVFVIKNALSGATRSTAPQRITARDSGYIYFRYEYASPNGTTTFRLPDLGANEYIDKMFITPMGDASNPQEGLFLPNNGISANYTAMAWDDRTWPDGTMVPAYSAVSMGGRLTYDDNPYAPAAYPAGYTSIPQIFELDNASVYYTSVPYAQAALLSDEASGREPGDTVKYQITGYNNSRYTIFGWADPRISIRVPECMELAGLEGAAPGTIKVWIDALTDVSGTASDGTTANVEVTFIGKQGTWNYYSFQVLSYSAPAINSLPVFNIPVQFRISATAAPNTYTVGSVLVSSLDAPNFFETILATNTNVSGLTNANTRAYYGFTAADNYRVCTLANTPLEIISLSKIGVKSAVQSSQTGGVFISSSVVPADQNENVQMRLTITNDGNAALTNIRLYDVLPYSGDAFHSTGAVEFVSVTTSGGGAPPAIRYGTASPNTASAPLYGKHGTYPTLDLQTSTFQAGAGWSATAPATISDATAIFVDFGTYQLAAGVSIEIYLTFYIPSSANQTAYNQFWYSAIEVGDPSRKIETDSPVSGFSTEAMMLEYRSNLPTATLHLNDLANMPPDKSAIFNVSGDGSDLRSLLLDGAPTAPTLTGYYFDGWNTQADRHGVDYSAGFSFQFTAPGRQILYVNWVPNTIAIEYNLNDTGGAATANPFTPDVYSTSVSFGDAIGQYPGDPVRTGYDFIGWYDTQAKAAQPTIYPPWNFASDIVTDPGSGTKTMYAGWQGKEITVNFMNNYSASDTSHYSAAEALNNTPNTKRIEGLLTAPAEPTRVGYDFGGWFTNQACTGAPWSFPINTLTALNGVIDLAGLFPSLTLYAKWTGFPVAISLDKNAIDATDGTVTSISGKSYGGIIGIDLPVDAITGAPTRAGYAFTGWATTTIAAIPNFRDNTELTTANGVRNAATAPTLTLYAVWTRNTYTITYSANAPGATGVMPDQTAVYNLNLTLATNNFIRTGYTFEGWATSPVSTTVAYANGYTFTPWSMLNGLNLYAVWDANDVTVTLDLNGAGALIPGNPSPITGKKYDGTIGADLPSTAANTPIRAGFTFEGWNTAATGDGVAYTETTPLTTANGVNAASVPATLTLYAVWTPAAGSTATYSVRYDANWISIGGAGAGTVPVDRGNYRWNDSVTVLSNTGNLARTGYTFVGWSTNADATSPAYTVSGATVTPSVFSMVTNDVVLYAVWMVNNYTINFNANGGTGSPPLWTGNIGGYIDLPEGFTRSDAGAGSRG